MEMIVFAGLPGSGKSTYYKEHYFNTHLRISNDLLKTKNRTKRLLDFCKETEMSFVVDNTCTTKNVRKQFLDFCETIDGEVKKICIYFDTPVEVCIERNEKRKGPDKVPVAAIFHKLKEFEIPEIEEGFDEMIVIKTEAK